MELYENIKRYLKDRIQPPDVEINSILFPIKFKKALSYFEYKTKSGEYIKLNYYSTCISCSVMYNQYWAYETVTYDKLKNFNELQSDEKFQAELELNSSTIFLYNIINFINSQTPTLMNEKNS